jgi:RHS repeat-associated protein
MGTVLEVPRRTSYYRARYYDAATGRFLSEDPIGFSGGANFYPYAESIPTLLVDPDGLDPNWGPIVTWFHLFWPGPQVYIPSVVNNLHCTTPAECNFASNHEKLTP